jgi:hypothetical protein
MRSRSLECRSFRFAGVASPLALRHFANHVASPRRGHAARLELHQNARIEPDMHAAILGALRSTATVPSANVAAIGA